jgi:hypothetical protein
MKVEFIKERYYKKNKYKTGDIVEMNLKDFRLYDQFKAVKKITFKKNNDKKNKKITVKKVDNLENYTLKELQDMCKENNISYAGKKKELINQLKEVI